MVEGVRVTVVNPVLVVVAKSPANVVTTIVLAVCVDAESIEGVLEVQILEIAVVLVKVVLMPVPGMAVSCALCQRPVSNPEWPHLPYIEPFQML